MLLSAVGEVIIFNGHKSMFLSSGRGGPICHSPISELHFKAVLHTCTLLCSDLSFSSSGFL